MQYSDTGYVVPTLGTRPQTFEKSIRSLVRAGVGVIVVVAPESLIPKIQTQFPDVNIIFCADSMKGLPAAINQGVLLMPSQVVFINWLGDDDLLHPDAITHLRCALIENESASLAFGRCTYLSAAGTPVFQTRSRKAYVSLMRFGPQLISQPAALFKRDEFNKIGGLNPALRYAFDLDLFIRLAKLGQFTAVPTTCAYFGWHSESLSVTARSTAVKEASAVRMQYRHPITRLIMAPYEFFLRQAISLAGEAITLRHKMLESQQTRRHND